jgi:hypothetical protein
VTAAALFVHAAGVNFIHDQRLISDPHQRPTCNSAAPYKSGTMRQQPLLTGHPLSLPSTSILMSAHSSTSNFTRLGEKRSISAFSEESSVITGGGTKRVRRDASARIVALAIKLMSQLEEHAKLFLVLGEEHDWFNSMDTTLSGSTHHLITSILVHGDVPTNRKIANFTCELDPSAIANIASIIKNHTISLPTYADLADDPVHGKHLKNGTDSAAHSLAQILLTQNDIADLADSIYGHQRRPPPFEFGQRGGWWKTQEGKDAILCHRPASKRPNLPLKLTHVAFYEFNRGATFSEDELEESRRAAFNLAKSVTDSLKKEKLRAAGILEALTGIFPVNSDFIWEIEQNVANRGRIDLIYRRLLPESYNLRFAGENETARYTNIIIIEVKLEEGHGGDAFMQLCRYFDIIIRLNPRYCETGAPTFLITISGMSGMFILMTFGLIPL